MDSIDFAPEEFYSEIASLQEDEDIQPSMQTFINCLLASADYESFYKVMAKQGNQRVLKKSLNSQLLRRAESKSEAKEGDDAKSSVRSAKHESKAEEK